MRHFLMVPIRNMYWTQFFPAFNFAHRWHSSGLQAGGGRCERAGALVSTGTLKVYSRVPAAPKPSSATLFGERGPSDDLPTMKKGEQPDHDEEK